MIDAGHVRAGTIEVHRDPTSRGFRTRTLHQRGETCAPLAFPDLAIAVSDVVG